MPYTCIAQGCHKYSMKDATVQTIIQVALWLDTTILHCYALLVFTIHAHTGSSICKLNTCLLIAFAASSIRNHNNYYWQRGWMLQYRLWYSWTLQYRWHAARIVVSDYFCSICLYTVKRSYTQAWWSLQNWKLVILNNKCIRFCAIILMKKAADGQLSPLPRGHAQVVEPSPPIITIAKKNS